MNIVVYLLLLTWYKVVLINANVDQLLAAGDCSFYDAIEKNKRCGGVGYVMAFGRRMCKELRSKTILPTDNGVEYFKDVNKCLMQKLKNNDKLSCDELSADTLDHIDCYFNYGDICHVRDSWRNRLSLWSLPWKKDKHWIQSKRSLYVQANKRCRTALLEEGYVEDGAKLKYIPHKESCLNIVSRSRWGAQSPKKRLGYIGNIKDMVFIHHSGELNWLPSWIRDIFDKSCYSESDCKKQVKAIQEKHMDGAYDDIAYSFLIGEDGNVYEGRGWNTEGGHTCGYNKVSYGIAFLGNFSSRKPNAKAILAAQELIRCGVRSGKLASNYEVFGHRDGRDTVCPGNELYSQIQSWDNYSRRRISENNSC